MRATSHRIDPVAWLLAGGLGTTPRDRTDPRRGGGEGRPGHLARGTGRARRRSRSSPLGLITYSPSRDWTLAFYRRERTERRCAKAFVAAGIDMAFAPAVLAEHPTPSGAVLDLALSPRCTATDLATHTERLAVAFGAASARVREDRRAAGRAQLVLAHRDPLAEAPIVWPWIALERSHLWGGLPFGYDEDDALVVLELAGHHLLLGGEPGAGKSNALSLVVAAAALDPDVELWCFDGKLVELAAWRRCCRRFVGADLEKATAVLQELRGEMETRYAWMLERGLTQDRTGQRTGPRSRGDRRAGPLPPGQVEGPGRARRSAPRHRGPGPGRRDRGGRGHPEARFRRRADLDPGPLRVPAGPALRDPGRLGHRARRGLGGRGLHRLRPRSRPPRRRVPARRRLAPAAHALLRARRRPPRAARATRRAPAGDGPMRTPDLEEALVVNGILARLNAPGGYDAFSAQVRGARACRRPVRLKGRITRSNDKERREVVFDSPRAARRGAAESLRDEARDRLPALCLPLPRGRLRPRGGGPARWQGDPRVGLRTIRRCS